MIITGLWAIRSSGPAHALCAYYEANYQGGASGACAVTQGYCYAGLDQNGGALSTTANAESVVSMPYTDANSSAGLSSGALTADSAAGSASASIWDTFTYSDLPSGEALIEATLTLPRTLTGHSSGSAILESGSQADCINSTEAMSYAAFDGVDPKPASISLMFEVTDGTPVTVFSEIVAFGDGAGGVADLADSPTLRLALRCPLGRASRQLRESLTISFPQQCLSLQLGS